MQVRGYKIRLPLDIILVASANPEDYTNRGRIITPLKDRFGSQVRTHYPPTIDIEIDIVDQEAQLFAEDGVNVRVPAYMKEVVATLSHLARASGNINQRSGVSVRLTVSNQETMVANAARRSIGHAEEEIVPRVSDLDALTASTMGKVEIESLEDGRELQIVDGLIKSATLTVFKNRVNPEVFRTVLDAFEGGLVANAGEDVSSSDYVRLVSEQPALRGPVQALTDGDESPGMVASAVEFLLEGLHLSKRLNKDAVGGRASYRARS
ncbi:MAG: hypothetical protein R2749_11720 [Acidimicrobiales bacterium]